MNHDSEHSTASLVIGDIMTDRGLPPCQMHEDFITWAQKQVVKWHFSISTFLESGLKMGHSIGNGYTKKVVTPLHDENDHNRDMYISIVSFGKHSFLTVFTLFLETSIQRNPVRTAE